jgi:cysteinyl-tRNA synthetase
MNITDVGHLSSDADTGEDKMLEGAKREKKSVLEIANMYTEVFKKDCEKLNIDWPKIISKATDNIPEYIEMIENLLEKGYAYIALENVYFDTSKVDNYYKLTNQSSEDMLVGAREDVGVDENKRHPADFVLWFTKSKFADQELKWESPWGVGYPGWHLECSAISIKYLGEYLDIHCGGVDNIFPHHTNEIAQSEAYLGHEWCKYWVHGEHLNDKEGKMSKSKGEFLTVSLLEEKGYNPLYYRFMCLKSHYRNVLDFNYKNLDNASIEYKKLKNKISSIIEEGDLDKSVYDKWDEDFKKYISEDLNTANAITLLYNLLKDEEVNGNTKLSLVNSWDKVFSLNLLKKDKQEIENASEILEKINMRNLAKENKDFETADAIRDELLKEGIKLIDSKEGTTYELI